MNETDAIRSDIEMTRRRMDDTMDALGERLHGRHLLDEIIGFFRGGNDGSDSGERVRAKVTQSAGNAANAVIDTVKKNPLPIILLTAGAAWLTYSALKGRSSESEPPENEGDEYDPDLHYDRPIEYPGAETAGTDEATGGTFERMKDTVAEKASAAKDTMQRKWSAMADQTRDRLHAMGERASEVGGRVQERTREMYAQTRDRVAETVENHPLEVGLGCLVAGVLVGLAIPTPDPVHRMAGSTVDRVKQRTRDSGREALEKGRKVAWAAMEAAKREAEAQGLTLEGLRETARSAIAGNAPPANQPTAESGGNPPAGSEASDPPDPRPSM